MAISQPKYNSFIMINGTWTSATAETRMMTPVSICSSTDSPVFHIYLGFLNDFLIDCFVIFDKGIYYR